MTQNDISILCIEDDADTCDLITFLFKDAGYDVTACSDKDCLELIHKKNFLTIILDNNFDGISGIGICREIRGFDQTTPIVFFSGEARQEEIEKALAAGASAYFVKPNDLEKLVSTTVELIERAKITQRD